MLPSVTWPSPPMATRSPRRTETMVVPWNSGGFELILGAIARGRAGSLPEIAFYLRGISVGLAAHQDGVAVDTHRFEKRRVELVQAGEDDALPGELDRLHHVEERRGESEFHAQDLRHVDDDLAARRRVGVELRDLVGARGRQNALEGMARVRGGGRERRGLRRHHAPDRESGVEGKRGD